MHDPLQYDRLNDLVVRMYRSLLQYANECWPWGGMEEAVEHKVIAELAAKQQYDVQRLVDLLQVRGDRLEIDSYPTEFGDLHYVALEYLMHMLLKDEAGVIAELEQEAKESAKDLEVSRLLQETIESEKQTVARLQELAKRAPAALS